jgi:hypothetical protein
MKMKVKELAKVLGKSIDVLKPWESRLPWKSMNIDSLSFYVHEHSWAGSSGITGKLIYETTREIRNLESGGWYSQNGNIGQESPSKPALMEIARNSASSGDILVIHSFDSMNNRDEDEWYYYVITKDDIIKAGNLLDEFENKDVLNSSNKPEDEGIIRLSPAELKLIRNYRKSDEVGKDILSSTAGKLASK